MLIGSVAAKILHDADCPVWTSAHVEEPHGAPEGFRVLHLFLGAFHRIEAGGRALPLAVDGRVSRSMSVGER